MTLSILKSQNAIKINRYPHWLFPKTKNDLKPSKTTFRNINNPRRICFFFHFICVNFCASVVDINQPACTPDMPSFSACVLFPVNKLNSQEGCLEKRYNQSSLVVVLTLYSARIKLKISRYTSGILAAVYFSYQRSTFPFRDR